MFNRAWIEARLSRKAAAGAIKGLLTLTVLAWFLIWMFADDDLRGNFNQAVKSMWSEIAR